MKLILAAIPLTALALLGCEPKEEIGNTRDGGTTATGQKKIKNQPMIVGNGEEVKQSRKVEPFTKLNAEGSIKVVFTAGKATQVEVLAQANIQSLVTATVDHGTLQLKTKGNYSTDKPILVTITSPNLDALKTEGSITLTANGFETKSMDIKTEGACELNLSGKVSNLKIKSEGSNQIKFDSQTPYSLEAKLEGASKLQALGKLIGVEAKVESSSELTADTVTTKTARLEVDGASQVRLKGTSDKLYVTASGSPKVELSQFIVQEATAIADGAAEVKLNVKNKLTGAANGAATVEYAGNPPNVAGSNSDAAKFTRKR